MKPKVTRHSATYALEGGGFLHIDKAIMPIRIPKNAKPISLAPRNKNLSEP